MKKILLSLSIMLCTLGGFTQNSIQRPINPDKNVGVFGGTYSQLNFVDHLEFGVITGVNFKDIAMVGPYYQKSIKGTDLYGIHAQVNVNPKAYYFTIGYSVKVGLVDHKFLYIEPGMTMQHNSNNDKFRFCHTIGYVGGWPSYSFGVIFGNFGEKWWRNPYYPKDNSLLKGGYQKRHLEND